MTENILGGLIPTLLTGYNQHHNRFIVEGAFFSNKSLTNQDTQTVTFCWEKKIKYAKSIGVDRVGFSFQNVKAHKPKGGQQNYIEVQFVSKYQLVY